MLYVRLWIGLAVVNLLLALGDAASGEWHDAVLSLCFAGVDAYVALLLHDRERLARSLRSLGVRDT